MNPTRQAMGIATKLTQQNKLLYQSYLDKFIKSNSKELSDAVESFFSNNAKVHMSHPINKVEGNTGYLEKFLFPLLEAFEGLQRQDYVMIGGEYQGSEWVTSTGYFYGNFVNPFLGIPPSKKMAFLRYGEFLKIENDRVIESYCFIGVAELIIDLGLWPLEESKGYEGVVPGPATYDGIVLENSDPLISRKSADLVEEMCRKLGTDGRSMEPYWDKKMVWYGPGGLGTYSTISAFEAFQVPFEKTFKGWGDGQKEGISGVGSNCKAGDGNYVFLCGWPQLTGVHIKNFLGIETTNKRIYMRDCDWWRCQNGKIIENWCMVDTLDLVLQLGRDVIAEIK